MLVREVVTGQLWSSVNCSWGNISIRVPVNLWLQVICQLNVFLIKSERLISFKNAFIDESLNEMKYLFQIEKNSKDSLGFLFWFCLILFSFIGIKIVRWMLFFFSFDPDNDPMCVLLMIDFYALRASEYSFLIRMFQEWEVKKHFHGEWRFD